MKMKTIKSALAAIAMVGVSTPAFAQSTHTPTTEIQINFANIAFGNYSAFVGYNTAADITLGSVFGYQNLTLTDDVTDEQISYTGFYVAPEARLFFNPGERGNDGWYGMGYLKYRSAGTSGAPLTGVDLNGNSVNYDQHSNAMALGIGGGRLWSTRVGVNFSIWAGLGYYLFNARTYSVDIQDPTIETNLPAIDFRWGVNVGYRF